MQLFFPPDPTLGQRYVGINAVTYTWVGDRWTGRDAIEAGVAEYHVDNGDATFDYNPDTDDLLDGGTA